MEWDRRRTLRLLGGMAATIPVSAQAGAAPPDPAPDPSRPARLELTATIPQGPEDYTSILAWSPDGKRLATAGISSHYARIWDVASRRLIARLGLGHSPSTPIPLSWSPDGRFLATVAQHALTVWNTERWTVEASFFERSAFGRFNQSGALLVAHGGIGRNWKSVSLRHPPDWREAILLAPTGTSISILGIAAGQDPSRFLVAFKESLNGRTSRYCAVLRDLESTRPLTDEQRRQDFSIPDGPPEQFAFSPDGRFFAVCPGHRPTRLYADDEAFASGSPSPLLEIAGSGRNRRHSFSGDSHFLALGDLRRTGGLLQLVDCEQRILVDEIAVQQYVHDVSVSPTDHTLAVANGPTIQLWSIATGA